MRALTIIALLASSLSATAHAELISYSGNTVADVSGFYFVGTYGDFYVYNQPVDIEIEATIDSVNQRILFDKYSVIMRAYEVTHSDSFPVGLGQSVQVDTTFYFDEVVSAHIAAERGQVVKGVRHKLPLNTCMRCGAQWAPGTSVTIDEIATAIKSSQLAEKAQRREDQAEAAGRFITRLFISAGISFIRFQPGPCVSGLSYCKLNQADALPRTANYPRHRSVVSARGPLVAICPRRRFPS